MSVFDEAKDKAQDFMGQAKGKLDQQNNQNQDDDQQREGNTDELRDKASDALRNAKERFGK